MSVSSILFSVRFWAVFAFLAVAFLFMSAMSAAPVGADVEYTSGACWVSGTFKSHGSYENAPGLGERHDRGYGFGTQGEFTIDKQDFFRVAGNAQVPLKPAEPARGLGYFSSLVSAADFSFRVSREDMEQVSVRYRPEFGGSRLWSVPSRFVVLRMLLDRGHPASGCGNDPILYCKYRRVNAGSDTDHRDHYWWQLNTDFSRRVEIPYTTARGYYQRRVVARFEDDRVVSFNAQWVDENNPSGGLQPNVSDAIADTVGGIANVERSARQRAEGGVRLILGQGQDQAFAISGNFQVDGGTGTIGVTEELNSNLETIQTSISMSDQNDGEFRHRDSVATTTTYVDTKGNPLDQLLDGRDFRSDLTARRGSAGYSQISVPDTERDIIAVQILLDSAYREDFEFNLVDHRDMNPESFTYPRFGYAPQLFPRGTGDWLEVPGVAADISAASDTYGNLFAAEPRLDHDGYRQSVMVTPFDSANNWDHTYYDSTPGSFAQTTEVSSRTDSMEYRSETDWGQLRWPVNLEDMNWYLYRLPGTVGETEGQGYLAFWLSDEGTKWLLASGFSSGPPFKPPHPTSLIGSAQNPAGIFDPYTVPPWCGFHNPKEEGGGLAQTALAVWGKAECKLDFPSPSHPDSAPWGDPPDEDDLVNGKATRAFYPFFVSATGTTAGVHEYPGLERFFQNQAIESPDVYDYHPVLVRAGAARPFDATGPRDATGRSLSSFHFQIAEHEPVDSLRSLSGSRFSAIEHGVPTDPDLAEKYYEVWPNEPLNPNRAHLLVTTYYEASSPRTTGGHEYVKLIVEDPVSAVGAHPGFFDFDDHQYLADGFAPARQGASASNCEEHETTHYSFFIEQTDGTYLQTGPVVTAEWWNTHPDDFKKEPNSYAMTEAELASGAPTHWTSICDLEDLAYDTEFRVPERHIRRVICRFLVYPAAWNPTAESWNDKFAAKFTDTIGAIKNVYDAITGWFSAMLGIGGQAPSWAGETAAEFTCVGVSAVEHLTSSAIAEPAPNTIAADGSVVPNRVAQGKRDAADMCRRLSNPPVSSCESPSDILLSDGRCMPSPELVLSISPNSSDHMFVSPAPVVRTTGYPLDPDADPDGGPQGSSRVTFTTVLSQRVSPDRYQVGLTDLQVNFDFAWSSVASEYYSGVHGYIVGVRADAEVVGPNNRQWETYVLPPRVAEFVACPLTGGDGFGIDPEVDHPPIVHSVVMHPVESFSFGSLRRGHRSPHGYEPFFVPSLPYQIPRFGEPGYDRNFYADFVRPGTVPDHCYWDATPVGGPRTLVDYRRLAEDLARMPLAPGYDHEFVVAPYVEGVALDSYVGGPVSPIFTIRGGEAACLAVDFSDPDPSNFIGVPSGLDAAASFYSHLDQQYGCSERALASYRPDTSVPDSFRLGFLGLASSDLCGDIFSTNPPAMTWANPVVIQVWALMWILAGSVFFILLLWQALKMTYDVWLEPRPATGFREMVPRFLLALALAAGSFYLCKWILVLTGDFTCFVAQTTGMSLWGVVKETFLVVIDGFLVAHDNIITDQHWLGSTTDTVKRFMTVFSMAFVTLVILIILLILFVKVGLAMILRLALLAVLVAFSPLAFAFFASESTAHWTKKWFSMFMGSVAQQAVVLLVIYIGAHLIGRYLERAGDDFAVFIIGALLGVATLVLADSVPKIVNPASQGLFQSLGSVVSMGAAGAIMAVTAGAGALAGAVRGPGRPPTGTIGSGGGGGGDSDGGSSPGGSSSGGSSSGSSTGAIGTGGGGGGGVGGGGFRSAIAGSALGAGVYGGLRGLRAASRPLQHVGQGAYQGLQSGMARGGQYNTGMRDLYTGSFLNRHGSTGDDAASRMESLEDTIRDTLPPRGRGG